MVRLLLAFALLCAIPASFAQSPAAPLAATSPPAKAGQVELIEGEVRFFDASRRMRRPRVGDVINECDSIATGADGEVHLRMEDGGYIAVRPGTRMRIVNFRAEGDAEDRSVIALLEGSFRAVTGWIAKRRPRNAEVRTPTATIGVRGTEHEPLVIPEGSSRGEPGTYDRVHVGETEIRTKQGTVAVRPNQSGFAPIRGALRPRVLDRVPEFYRPTRNEARFTGLHGRVHQQLDQRRDERRKFIEERQKAKGERKGQDKGGKAEKGAKADARKAEKRERGPEKGKADERRKEVEQRRPEKQQRPPDERQLERRQRQEEFKRKAEERRQDKPEARKAEKRERPDKSRTDERKGEKRSKGDK